MAKLKLTNLQKLGAKMEEGKSKNQVLHSDQNQGENKKTIQN